MKKGSWVGALAICAVIMGGAGFSHALLVDLGPGSFIPLAPQITFSEFALGSVDPSINLAAGSLGNVTVSFGGHFVGQAATPPPAPVVTLVRNQASIEKRIIQ